MIWQGTGRVRCAVAALAACACFAASAAASPDPAGVASMKPDTPSAGSHLLIDAKGADAGFRQNEIPTALGWAFEKGYVLDATAAPGKCTVDQAKNGQCPADSQLGSGDIGVILPGDRATAKIQFFRADPPNPGDQSGIILYFNDAQDGYSDAGIGSIRQSDDPAFGELIRFDKLPLPNLPPGLNITLDHIQLDFGAGTFTGATETGDATAPGKHARKHHKVRLKCKRYRPRHGKHRKCVAFRHGKNARVKSHAHAHASASGSFIVNPSTCDSDGWTVQLQVDYKDGSERREAQAACAAG
jgi:hypothetical protein